ncbi:hypothetical protein BOTNAR_0064g00010 [Botryotinia narcissicola]|uniref:Uncharacterized protein n=1 Tax=Botryotinia narcissicola TaxID=278944 RepID=A0A4Z1IZH3_9HELO|nr:hypothetical protein BOTNAR_0064g00010 [Botryotinia narcissicola]
MDEKSSPGSSSVFDVPLSPPLTRAPGISRRQGGQGRVSCGYYYGDAQSPLYMGTDSTCTTAYPLGIWGSCIYSSNVPVCSLYGACVDDTGCTDGCTPNVNFNINAITVTLSCSTDYCQSYLLSDQSSPSLGTQTSYTCNSTSQTAPVLIFASALDTPMSVLARTTSVSDILVTSSLKSGFIAASTFSGPRSTSSPSTSSTTSSSSSSSSSTQSGTIGGLAFITLIILTIWLFRRHRKRHAVLSKTELRFDVRDPSDHVHELMEKSGNTPKIGGEMLRAEMESPRMNMERAEIESPTINRERFEMGALKFTMSEKFSTGKSIVQTIATATLHEPSYINVTKTIIAASDSSFIEPPSLTAIASRSLMQETVAIPSSTQKFNYTSVSQSLVRETVSIPSPTRSSIETTHKNTTAIVAGDLRGFIFVGMLLAGYYFLRGYQLRHRTATKARNDQSILPEKDDGKNPVHEMTREGKLGYTRQEIEGNSLSELEKGGRGKHQEPVELLSSFPCIGTSYWL